MAFAIDAQLQPFLIEMAVFEIWRSRCTGHILLIAGQLGEDDGALLKDNSRT